MEAVVLNGRSLTLEQAEQIVFENRPVALDKDALQRCREARETLLSLTEQGKAVYGMNRGVGWNKDKAFEKERFASYNRSLLLSHACSAPPYADQRQVRAMMLIRLNTALCACTGLSIELLEQLAAFLNRGVHPCVPKRGSVGEGDIGTLSHIGLACIGEGQVHYRGQLMPAGEALQRAGLAPASLGPKDGLGLLSSNAHGAALTALVLLRCRRLLKLCNLTYCLSLEGLNGDVQPLGEKVNAVRGLEGQINCAAACREALEGSYLFSADPARALQDPLSFRCACAVHGAFDDCSRYVSKLLLHQINSSDDNPCIFSDTKSAGVSANFEVTSLALGVEMLNSALCHVSRLVYQRVIRLDDPAFTKLSRFLTPQEGACIAFGTTQKTIAYLDTENRFLANPSSMDIQALAGAIEDHSSYLPLAAEKTLRLTENLTLMLALELMHGAQAVDLRKASPLGKKTALLYGQVRSRTPFYGEDRCISNDIAALQRLVEEENFIKALNL